MMTSADAAITMRAGERRGRSGTTSRNSGGATSTGNGAALVGSGALSVVCPDEAGETATDVIVAELCVSLRPRISASACPIAAIDGKRLCGCLLSARTTTASSAGSIPGEICERGTGSAAQIFATTSRNVPSNARRPESSSYATAPAAN